MEKHLSWKVNLFSLIPNVPPPALEEPSSIHVLIILICLHLCILGDLSEGSLVIIGHVG